MTAFLFFYGNTVNFNVFTSPVELHCKCVNSFCSFLQSRNQSKLSGCNRQHFTDSFVSIQDNRTPPAKWMLDYTASVSLDKHKKKNRPIKQAISQLRGRQTHTHTHTCVQREPFGSSVLFVRINMMDVFMRCSLWWRQKNITMCSLWHSRWELSYERLQRSAIILIDIYK